MDGMDMWYRYLIGIFSDINNCVCFGDADALLSLRILYSFFLFCIFLFHFRTNLRSLSLSGNRCDRIKTLTQLADWSLFVVDYFIL